MNDSFGRKIDYLRLSVTDRCDLRCAYCMPQEFNEYEAPADWLTFDEIDRVAGIFIGLGVRKIRLTGGEPLLRARLGDLVERLRRHENLHDLSLSTNGTRLQALAPRLRAAGVDRLNVSLDTLQPQRYAELTRRDVLGDVLDGLEAARACGFKLIKINMVWLPEVNGDEVISMIDYCLARGFILRLIENMPMGDSARQLGSQPLQPLIARLRQQFGLVDHVLPGGGPARYLTTPDRSFSVGFITPLSQHFCETCNRVRLAVDGTLHLCLGQENKLSLRELLRGGSSDAEIAERIRLAIAAKPAKHDFVEAPEKIIRIMASTGG